MRTPGTASISVIRLLLSCGLLLPAVMPAAAGPHKASYNSPLADSLRKTAKAPGAAEQAAMKAFAKKTGTNAWRVRYSPRTALPEAIVGAKTARYPGSPAAAALAFLDDNKDLLRVDTSQLRRAYSKVLMGITHIQYEQIYNSVPVEFAYVRVHVDSSGRVIGYQSKFEPDIAVPLSPSVPASRAESAVLSDLGFSARVSARHLVLFPDHTSAGGELKLAWKVRARAADTVSGIWVYYINAADGAILFRYNDLRYACADNSKSTGTVRGTVYPISPNPTGPGSLQPDSWVVPVSTPINNQYVWVTSSLTSPVSTVTAGGEYCSTVEGKVFASLKGPYFSVVNFRGASAHFDNGGGEWSLASTAVQSPNPYANSQTYNYSVTIPDTWSVNGWAFAKVMPRFASFSVGGMDEYGSVLDNDQLHVKNGADIVGSYIGSRTQPFLGAPVENTSYGLTLQTDESGTSTGFAVNVSSYLVIKNAPLVKSNSTGSIMWSTSSAASYLYPFPGNVENTLAEINVFYHLNTVHDYFTRINKDPAPGAPVPADLSSKQVPVMVHASGAPDASPYRGMLNAFYDLESDNIFLGDGPLDLHDDYRSFALDGTIVRHEYVHRVINQIYPIINFGEFGALSEAMADFFSIASFLHEGYNISKLGNFIDVGEASARDLAGAARVMPGSWGGEIHDDSLILSQPLWTLRNDLGFGTFSSGVFAGMSKIDVLVYAALFYFPDNFANFYDAMIEACDQFNEGFNVMPAGSCNAADRNRITVAFSAHGIPSYTYDGGGNLVDSYDRGDGAGNTAGNTLCRNNNGPECATDISTMTRVSANIYPAADLDYYSVPLPAGNFTATLTLPAGPLDQTYHPYAVFLFDASRKYLTEAVPSLDMNSMSGACESADCLTFSKSITLSYTIPAAGIHYLLVSAAPNSAYGNSTVNSPKLYTLSLDYAPKGSAQARLDAAVFDRDTISFTVPYALFASAPYGNSIATDTTGAEIVFDYAQLRDHNSQPLALARTDIVGGYLSKTAVHPAAATDASGRPVIAGKVVINPGFSGRYPGVGTVYLEIFGRNHMRNVISMGVSNAINLTTNKSDLVTYNNIITSPGDRSIIKYDVQASGSLSIKVYTVAGTLVKTVFEGNVSAGKGTLDWDGTNSGGSKVASGIYFIKAKGPGLEKVDKIAVVR